MIDLLEDLNRAVVRLVRQHTDICVPAKAKIQSQTWAYLVIVLNVEGQLMDLLVQGSLTIEKVDKGDRAWRLKTLRVQPIKVVLYRERIIEEPDLVTLGAEEKETAKVSVDVINPELQALAIELPRKIVSELVLLLHRRLRHHNVGPSCDCRKLHVGTLRHTQDLIRKVQIVKGKKIELRRAEHVGMVDHKIIAFRVIRIAIR